MSGAAWTLIILAVWLGVSVLIVFAVGRAVRLRDSRIEHLVAAAMRGIDEEYRRLTAKGGAR